MYDFMPNHQRLFALSSILGLTIFLLGCGGSSVPPPNEADSSALEAAEAEDWDKVITTIADGASPDAIWVRGRRGNYSLLRYAIDQNNMQAAQDLIAAGADVNLRYEYEKTVLFDAVRDGDLEMIRVLFDAGADPNVQDGSGETPLVDYAVWGDYDIEVFRLLLENGADPNLADENGYTALHSLAYMTEEPDEVELAVPIIVLLLTEGADPSLRSEEEDATAADFARENGQDTVAEAIEANQ